MSGYRIPPRTDPWLPHEQPPASHDEQCTSNTPGFAGYVKMILLAWLVFDLIVLSLVGLGSPATVLPAVGLVLGGTVILGTPIGIIGALIVHVTCRNEPRQSRHILAAALSGWGCTVLLGLAVGQDKWGLVVGAVVGILVGGAAAFGRAMVSP